MLVDISSIGGQQASQERDGAAADGEDMSRTERASIVIDKDVDHCFNVAANLDSYM